MIAEVPISERAEGGCLAADFIALMRSHGFAPCDVIDAGLTPMGIHIDAIFRRSGA